ncbi:hypothetical protein [Armatimonas sp.]|uniref:hypothetical protein n=1 Tax=Armatimonas sp. TaxID=1872638 RepID=UPI00374DCA9C
MRDSLLAAADLMAGTDKVQAKAAMLRMAQTIHTVCRPGGSKTIRADYLKELLDILGGKRPRHVRAHATRLVGYIGSKTDDKALARFAADPELKADIQMARERLRRGG